MKLEKIAVLAFAVSLAGAVFAGEQKHHEMKFVFASDDGDDVKVMLDSDDLGFSLDDLEVGESRSIVDDSGRTVLISRKESGLQIDVNGKTIDLPTLDIDHDGEAKDVDIRIVRDAEFVAVGEDPGTLILTAEPVDAATQELIRTSLQSAGHSGEVRFIDRAAHHGDGEHHVKIIKKHVEVSE